MKNIAITVRTIKFINGFFLLNGKIWLNKLDVAYMYNNIGMSTSTSFVMLIGATLTCDQVVISEEDITNEDNIVEHRGKEIKFGKPGTKHLGWEIDLSKSPRLLDKFMATDITTVDFMADMPSASTPVPSTIVQEETVPDELAN